MDTTRPPTFESARFLFEHVLFPEAIILGMPSHEFWDSEPSWFFSYAEAFKLKWSREEEYRSSLVDYQSWLTGMYCYQGFGALLSNMFKKGSKAKYPMKPISMKDKKKTVAKADSDEELKRQYQGFKMLADQINRNRRQ